MGRLYAVPIDIAAFTAAQDILEIVAATEKPIAIHELVLTSTLEQDTNEEQIKLSVSRFEGAFTSGSGGSTVAGEALVSTDADDAATCEVGNTTQTTGGTEALLMELHFNNRVGLHYLPAPEHRIVVGGTDAFVVATQETISSQGIVGYCIYEELA